MRGLVIPSLLVILWEAGSRAGLLPPDSTSRPSEIVRAFVQALADGSLLRDTWLTFEAALLGFAIAGVLGILLGAILGLSPRTERTVGPSIEALRPIPAVALIPLALLVFGFGLRMEAAVVAFAAVWPVLLVTVAVVLNLLLWWMFIRPVTRISALADRISLGAVDAPDFVARGRDEIGSLAESLTRMRRSLAQAMKMLDE